MVDEVYQATVQASRNDLEGRGKVKLGDELNCRDCRVVSLEACKDENGMEALHFRHLNQFHFSNSLHSTHCTTT